MYHFDKRKSNDFIGNYSLCEVVTQFAVEKLSKHCTDTSIMLGFTGSGCAPCPNRKANPVRTTMRRKPQSLRCRKRSQTFVELQYMTHLKFY